MRLPKTASIPLLLNAVLLIISPLALREHRTSQCSVKIGNTTRSYLIHLPRSLRSNKAFPVVFVLHGGQSNARQMERYTGLSDIADGEEFLVVYPEGINRHWNDGRDAAPQVDDVGFVVALLEQLKERYNIDMKRIYATGISNGGMFSQRLACELSGSFAAIASVAASMPETQFRRCNPSRPISVLMMHGTADPLISYEGGAMPAGTLGGNVVSVRKVIDFWSAKDRCKRQITIDLPDRDLADGTTTRRDRYVQCAAGTEVVLYTLIGGGHTLPGGRQYLPKRLIGNTSRDIDGSQVIWEFFAAHPKE